ncbi:MAG: Hsp33 family molecular chaperone HslO [Treponema sp.]|nr:Hsp33 family molecular chaperone HslO [Treponema sp.]
MIQAQIEDTELVAHLDSLPKDDMAVFVMAEGRVRGALFHGTHFVNQMRAQHKTGILETMVLGQASLCGALLLPTMKGREHVTWRYEIDGPAQGFSIEADSSGYVRGYLFTDVIPVEKPLESWNLSPFLGEGTLSMATMHEGDREPYTSSVAVNHKNIALDLAYYFNQSEQIQTAFNTGIQMDKQGRVIGAGGMFLQVLPETGGQFKGVQKLGSQLNTSADKKADEDLIDRVELAFKTAPSLGQWFSEKGTIEDIVYGLFREFKPSIALHRDVRYDCPCSKESYVDYIRRLPKAELEDMKANGPDPLEVSCRNCGSVYHIPLSEIM